MIAYLLKKEIKKTILDPYKVEWKETDRLGLIIINQSKMMVAFVRVIEKMRSG